MILLSADDGMKADAIGARLGCQGQAVREAIHAFHREGLNSLHAKKRGRQDDQRAFDDAGREELQALAQRTQASIQEIESSAATRLFHQKGYSNLSQ